MYDRTKVALQLVCGLLILLFVYAAVSKLMDYTRFVAVIHHSPLIGPWAGTVAIVLPLFELGIATLLFLPSTKSIALGWASTLMLLFTLYILYMLTSTSSLPCSCGGVLNWLNWRQHLYFNILFTALALSGVWLDAKGKRRQGKGSVSDSPGNKQIIAQ